MSESDYFSGLLSDGQILPPHQRPENTIAFVAENVRNEARRVIITPEGVVSVYKCCGKAEDEVFVSLHLR